MSAQLSLGLRPGLYPDVVAGVLAAVLPTSAALAVAATDRVVRVDGVSRLGLLVSLARCRVRHALRARVLSWLAAEGDAAIEDRWSREVMASEHAGALLVLALRGRVSA